MSLTSVVVGIGFLCWPLVFMLPANGSLRVRVIALAWFLGLGASLYAFTVSTWIGFRPSVGLPTTCAQVFASARCHPATGSSSLVVLTPETPTAGVELRPLTESSTRLPRAGDVLSE